MLPLCLALALVAPSRAQVVVVQKDVKEFTAARELRIQKERIAELKAISGGLAKSIGADINATDLSADEKAAYGKATAALVTGIEQLAARAGEVKAGSAADNENAAKRLKASTDLVVEDAWLHSGIAEVLREVTRSEAPKEETMGLGNFHKRVGEKRLPSVETARREAGALKKAAAHSAAGDPGKAREALAAAGIDLGKTLGDIRGTSAEAIMAGVTSGAVSTLTDPSLLMLTAATMGVGSTPGARAAAPPPAAKSERERLDGLRPRP